MSRASAFFDLNQEISLTAGHERMVVFARHASGALAHIDKVDNGKACQCVCLACNEALIARQGDVRGHSFAHQSGTECKDALEAMLHGVAMALIERRGRFVTPALRVDAFVSGPHGRIADFRQLAATQVSVDAVALDKRSPWSRPCIVATIKGRELLIHIAVHHPAGDHKRQRLAELQQAAVEIDMSGHFPRSVTELAGILFSADKRKSWLFNPREAMWRAEIEATLQPIADAQWRQHREALEAQRALQAQRDLERVEQARRRAAQWAAERELMAQHFAAAAAAAAAAALNEPPAPPPPPPPRRQAPKPAEMSPSIEYESPQGRLWLLHSERPDMYFKADAGVEHALRVLDRCGAVQDPEAGVYRISREGWSAASIELARTWLAVRSVAAQAAPAEGSGTDEIVP
jgi:hypothetical protein